MPSPRHVATLTSSSRSHASPRHLPPSPTQNDDHPIASSMCLYTSLADVKFCTLRSGDVQRNEGKEAWGMGINFKFPWQKKKEKKEKDEKDAKDRAAKARK